VHLQRKEVKLKRVMSDNSMHPPSQGEDPNRLQEKQRSAGAVPRRPEIQSPGSFKAPTFLISMGLRVARQLKCSRLMTSVGWRVASQL